MNAAASGDSYKCITVETVSTSDAPSAVSDAATCVGETEAAKLLTASCTMDGFRIEVDEMCRTTEFFFVDFAHASFVDGNASTVEMPEIVDPMCIPQFENDSWTYRYLHCTLYKTVEMIGNTHLV